MEQKPLPGADEGHILEEAQLVALPTDEGTDGSTSDSDSDCAAFLKDFLGAEYTEPPSSGESSQTTSKGPPAAFENLARQYVNDVGTMHNQMDELKTQIASLAASVAMLAKAPPAPALPSTVGRQEPPPCQQYPVAPLLERRLARGELDQATAANLKASGAIRPHIQEGVRAGLPVEKALGSPISKTTASTIPTVKPSVLFGQLSGHPGTTQVQVATTLKTVTLEQFKEAVKAAVPEYQASLKKPVLKDSSTQTWVSQVHTFVHDGCGNCRRRGHNFNHCPLPKRPDVCHICGRDGTTTRECLSPHGRDLNLVRGRCTGCGTKVEFFNPTCDECNRRFPGHAEWLRDARKPKDA